MTILVYTCREFTLGYFRNGLRAGGQRKPGPLVVGELHFARLACAPKSRPQTMRRAPRTARLGKLPGGALGRFGRADFRDQPPRAHAVVAGRVPAKSRDPRRDFCPKPRPGEKRGPHIDRHLTSRCCRTSSQIVVGHVVNDVRRCGGKKDDRRSFCMVFGRFLGEKSRVCCRVFCNASSDCRGPAGAAPRRSAMLRHACSI